MVCPGGRKAGPLTGGPTRIAWKGRKQSPGERKGEKALRDRHPKATHTVRVLSLGMRLGEDRQRAP